MPDNIFLAHYGVKGMKWGIRRKDSNGDGRVDKVYSEDAARVKDTQTRGKKQGVQSLSNQEIQDVINRKNLEKQFKELTPSTVAKGRKKLEEFNKNAQVIDQTVKLASNSASTKLIKEAIKNVS